MSEREKNWEVAKEISREARADASSPYAGKYVGVAGERVVAVEASWDALDARMTELGLDDDNSVIIEASAEHDRVITFWSPYLMMVKPGDLLQEERD